MKVGFFRYTLFYIRDRCFINIVQGTFRAFNKLNNLLISKSSLLIRKVGNLQFRIFAIHIIDIAIRKDDDELSGSEPPLVGIRSLSMC